METNGKLHDREEEAPAAPSASGSGLKLALLFFLLMLVPVMLAAFVFPELSRKPFESIADLAPENVKSIRVQILNRTELNREEDRGPDVEPFYASPDDFAALLAPLSGAREVSGFEDARGPWFGEYRVMTKTGRGEPVRLYWSKDPKAGPNAPERLRFRVGGKWYEGGSVSEVIRSATAAQERGSGRR